ncbi:MAG: triose-phosphate isomerase [Chitinophagales bacterium]
MRNKIVAGNWKMNKTLSAAQDLGRALVVALKDVNLSDNNKVVICPTAPMLQAVGSIVSDSSIALGGQNCHFKESGAYTGEVSPSMLTSVGAQYVLLGHSERRQYFAESNELIKAKLDTALAGGLQVIFCCGESLSQRESGVHFDFVAAQIKETLYHLDAATLTANVVIAYEPIWAIGTGVTASAEQAEEMHAFIRQQIANQYSHTTAEAISILYGGSCKPHNAAELFANPNVDGGLIGGASLKADAFTAIIECMVAS